MFRRIALAAAVAAASFLAVPAQAGCVAVAGAGVCDPGYRPSPSTGSKPVYSPTEICYYVDCIAPGEKIADVPTVKVDGGTLLCVHVAYECVVPVDVPDL